ncbi:MAG: peptidyl-prolyl cis-trans isomerase [Gammaproteobacteria bacterium]|nr:peptidyl-prolyl cis-trans isomerase [Gammaproteobacteria bacterium]
MAEDANPTIIFETNRGAIAAEIFVDKSPITAKNFLKLVENDHFDGLIFHRVIAGFMIQGGGFDKNMQQKHAPETIKNESFNGVRNETGTLAMARTADPDSASAQFFINVVDNEYLNAEGDRAGYAVFGKVTSGMDVVREIEQSETGNEAGHNDVPKEKTVIHSVEIM